MSEDEVWSGLSASRGKLRREELTHPVLFHRSLLHSFSIYERPKIFIYCALAVSLIVGIAPAQSAPAAANPSASSVPTADLRTPEEKHLRNVRQLTFGRLQCGGLFFSRRKETDLPIHARQPAVRPDFHHECGRDRSEDVSTGKGRTTCSYIFPHGDKILYSSTHLADAACPPRPDFSKGYVWAIYPGYDIFTAKLDGSRMHNQPLRNAESHNLSEDGEEIVFTSTRNGDPTFIRMDTL